MILLKPTRLLALLLFDCLVGVVTLCVVLCVLYQCYLLCPFPFYSPPLSLPLFSPLSSLPLFNSPPLLLSLRSLSSLPLLSLPPSLLSPLFSPSPGTGFNKVHFDAGQTLEVGFALTDRDLSIWDVSTHSWTKVSGTFKVELGASSQDIRLSGELTV